VKLRNPIHWVNDCCLTPTMRNCPDPDPKDRNWRYWSQSTDFFLFGALLSRCSFSLYWSIELLRIGVQGLQ
jgi:hypothetical protein